MDDLSARSQPALILDLMMQALRVRDERLNAIAAELLVEFGAQPVRRLVLEAVSHNNTTAHRIRALNVLARIGPPFGESLMDLMALRRSRNKAVREAVAELFGDCGRPIGVPGT
jgi:HEAT repeat protein